MPTTQKLKGKANEMTGAAHRKAGALTGNREMQVKGAVQEVKGKAQQAVGAAKDKAHEVKEKVTHR